MTSPRSERGQVLVLTVAALTVLLGMTALVLDVGDWFRTKRQLQATADAAALAGAQALPDSPSGANSLALSYAGQNGGGVLGSDITIISTSAGNDTIFVEAHKNEPGFFSKVLGIDVVDVHARAKAIVGVPVEARYVAPMVVSCNHPLIKNCTNKSKLPVFNVATTLPYDKMGAPGAFGMLNLDGGNGTPGTEEEANWIQQGYDQYLPVNDFYRSDPGAKFSSNEIQGALDTHLSSGQPQYYIIGWIGFHLTSYDTAGSDTLGYTATLHGYFVSYIAQGILASSSNGNNGTNFGVKSIQLIQ
jgi:hypothetical protein